MPPKSVETPSSWTPLSDHIFHSKCVLLFFEVGNPHEEIIKEILSKLLKMPCQYREGISCLPAGGWYQRFSSESHAMICLNMLPERVQREWERDLSATVSGCRVRWTSFVLAGLKWNLAAEAAYCHGPAFLLTEPVPVHWKLWLACLGDILLLPLLPVTSLIDDRMTEQESNLNGHMTYNIACLGVKGPGIK